MNVEERHLRYKYDLLKAKLNFRIRKLSKIKSVIGSEIEELKLAMDYFDRQCGFKFSNNDFCMAVKKKKFWTENEKLIEGINIQT